MLDNVSMRRKVMEFFHREAARRDRRINMLEGHQENEDWHAAMDECADIQSSLEVLRVLGDLLVELDRDA